MSEKYLYLDFKWIEHKNKYNNKNEITFLGKYFAVNDIKSDRNFNSKPKISGNRDLIRVFITSGIGKEGMDGWSGVEPHSVV